MKTYTVNQIAEMLKTNPETVRRWIRDNKLESDISSRKVGNVVTEDGLNKFLKKNPKYYSSLAAGVATTAAAVTASMLAPGVGLPMLLGGMIARSFIDDKGKNGTPISHEDLVAYIAMSIEQCKMTKKQKESLIEQTQGEIAQIDLQISEYEKTLKEINDISKLKIK